MLGYFLNWVVSARSLTGALSTLEFELEQLHRWPSPRKGSSAQNNTKTPQHNNVPMNLLWA